MSTVSLSLDTHTDFVFVIICTISIFDTGNSYFETKKQIIFFSSKLVTGNEKKRKRTITTNRFVKLPLARNPCAWTHIIRFTFIFFLEWDRAKKIKLWFKFDITARKKKWFNSKKIMFSLLKKVFFFFVERINRWIEYWPNHN